MRLRAGFLPCLQSLFRLGENIESSSWKRFSFLFASQRAFKKHFLHFPVFSPPALSLVSQMRSTHCRSLKRLSLKTPYSRVLGVFFALNAYTRPSDHPPFVRPAIRKSVLYAFSSTKMNPERVHQYGLLIRYSAFEIMLSLCSMCSSVKQGLVEMT